VLWVYVRPRGGHPRRGNGHPDPARRLSDPQVAGVDRGIEPDNCYWIASELQVRDKTEIDLDLDPPPDLFVEIEITHCFLDRLEIAARLNVAEVWCFDGSVLKVLILQPDGTYSESDRSKAFPGFPVKDIAPFLKRTPDVDYLTQMRRFREWVRDRLHDSPNG
jgi:Uma2 family endonuclease